MERIVNISLIISQAVRYLKHEKKYWSTVYTKLISFIYSPALLSPASHFHRHPVTETKSELLT